MEVITKINVPLYQKFREKLPKQNRKPLEKTIMQRRNWEKKPEKVWQFFFPKICVFCKNLES